MNIEDFIQRLKEIAKQHPDTRVAVDVFPHRDSKSGKIHLAIGHRAMNDGQRTILPRE
jgi:hypothetical protein